MERTAHLAIRIVLALLATCSVARAQVQPEELHYFPAQMSHSALMQASDGIFYSTASGLNSSEDPLSRGTVYQPSADDVMTVTQGRDGKTYGVASPGDTDMMFRLSAQSSGEMAIAVVPEVGHLHEPFVLQGWAIDRAAQFDSGVDAVHVWARPVQGGNAVFIGSAGYGATRPDVAAVYGEQFTRSGFGITVRGLPPGLYEFVATLHSSVSHTFDFSAARTVIAEITYEAGSGPRTVVDSPGPDSIVLPAFTVSGWVADLAATTGTGVEVVHVWAVPESGAPPTFIGVAHYGEPRPDVAAAIGTQFFGSGYSVVGRLAPGRYRIDVAWRSTISGYWNAQAQYIEVRADTRLTIDGPQPGTVTRPFLISGWAIDLASASGSGVDAVHIWAFPTSGAAGQFLGAAPSSPRPDVGAIFGSQYTNSGYSLTVDTLAPGTYDLIVFARSTVTNSFNAARVVRVTVH